MEDRDGAGGIGERGLELEETAGIAGGNSVGSWGEGGDESGFSSAKLGGSFRLHQIVNASGAATDGRFGNFKQAEARDLGEELARLGANALRILEMAGIVKGDASVDGMAPGARGKFGEEFGDVFAFCGEALGASGVGGIIAENVGVVFHVRAATGGVDDDGIDVGLFEDVDGVAGEAEGGGFFSGMDAERATAGLILWGDNFAAFRGEDAGGGGVDVREKGALDTAEEKADTATLFALSESDGRDGFDGRDGREQRVHGGDGFGEQFEKADGAKGELQAGFAIKEERPAEQIEASGTREGFEEQAAMEFVPGRTMEVAFDLRASGFDEFAVFDTGGAGGHAGDATEAGIEMANECFVEGSGAVEGHFHEIDATAGGIHFFGPEDVGGTDGETEAAVNALVDQIGRGRLMGIEGAGDNGKIVFGGHGIRFPRRNGRD